MVLLAPGQKDFRFTMFAFTISILQGKLLWDLALIASLLLQQTLAVVLYHSPGCTSTRVWKSRLDMRHPTETFSTISMGRSLAWALDLGQLLTGSIMSNLSASDISTFMTDYSATHLFRLGESGTSNINPISSVLWTWRFSSMMIALYRAWITLPWLPISKMRITFHSYLSDLKWIPNKPGASQLLPDISISCIGVLVSTSPKCPSCNRISGRWQIRTLS